MDECARNMPDARHLKFSGRIMTEIARQIVRNMLLAYYFCQTCSEYARLAYDLCQILDDF